jgi:hypothetical protein
MRLSHGLSSDPFRLMTGKISTIDVDRGDTAPFMLTAVGLLLALESEAEAAAIISSPVHEIQRRCEDIQLHLTARCAGLLEVESSRNDAKVLQTSQIRYMHRTARDFIEQPTQWTKILSYTPPTTFSPSFSMMKACVSILRMGTSRCPISPQRMAQDVLIYGYHADGHLPTRRSQRELLTMLSEMKIEWKVFDMLPAKATFLQRATAFSLSGYVEETLSVMEKSARLPIIEALLNAYYRGSHLVWQQIPLPTAKMTKCLLALVPPQIDFYSKTKPWQGKPTIIGPVPPPFKMPLAIIPRFLETRISIVEMFLASRHDPTGTLGYIPESFDFCSERLQSAVQERLPPGCTVPSLVLDILREELQRAVRDAVGAETNEMREARDIPKAGISSSSKEEEKLESKAPTQDAGRRRGKRRRRKVDP